jgi:HK97 family phage major capsid protein
MDPKKCIHEEIESEKLWELKAADLEKCGCGRCQHVWEKKELARLQEFEKKTQIMEAAKEMGKQIADEYKMERKSFKEEVIAAAREVAKEEIGKEEDNTPMFDKVFGHYMERKMHYGFSNGSAVMGGGFAGKNVYANTKFGMQQKSPYHKAFETYLRTGSDMEIKAATTGVVNESSSPGSAGGYFVPEEWASDFVKVLKDNSALRAAGARVENIGTDTFHIPILSDDLADDAVKITAETTNASSPNKYNESRPTWDERVLKPYKLTRRVFVSEEQLEDSAYNIEGALNELFAEAFGLKEDRLYLVGAGGTEPKGITKETGVTKISDTSVTADALMKMVYTLKRPYRRNGVWILHTDEIRKIRSLNLSGTTNPAGVWSDGNLASGEPPRLLGYPVFEVGDESLPKYDLDGAGPGNTIGREIVFVNPQKFWIAQRRGLTIRRLNEVRAEDGLVVFLASMRVDGRLADDKAAALMTVNNV